MTKNILIAALFLVQTLYTVAQPEISVARYKDGRQAAVSYTFDDGLKEHYTKVFPRLKSLGLKATFCVIGSKVGSNMKGTPCVTWSELKEMAADGQEITSHGWAHKAVSRLSGESLRYEVQHNDSVIYGHTGVFPRTYFFPGNGRTPEAVDFCARDRVGLRLRQVSIGSKRDSTWLKHWLDGVIARGEWGIGMTHGITIGYDAFKDPEILWQHLAYARSLQDRLWIATFHDVAAYTAERDSVRLKTDYGKKYISVKPALKLNRKIFTMPLTLQIASTQIKRVEQGGKSLALTRRNGCVYANFNPYNGEIRIYR